MSDPPISAPPVPPVEPEPWQCCGSGCDPCVYDRYWEDVARYEEALERWQRTPGPAGAGSAADSAGDPAI